MQSRRGFAGIAGWAIFGLAGVANSTLAQMIQVDTPFNSVSDSFFERQGIAFGFQLAGGQGPGSRVVGLLPNGQLNPTGALVFSQGSVGSAVPPFGRFDPNAQATFGFGVLDGDGNRFDIGFFGGKGNNRAIVNSTPSVVVQNGTVGSVFDSQLVPFVTGITPVLGRGGMGPVESPCLGTPVTMPSSRWNWPGGLYSSGSLPADSSPAAPEPAPAPASLSTANEGSLSVREIQRRREAEIAGKERQRQTEIEGFAADAERLIAESKYGAARVAISRALRQIGTDSKYRELAAELRSRLEEIKDKRTP
jgi:hypothetical protein